MDRQNRALFKQIFKYQVFIILGSNIFIYFLFFKVAVRCFDPKILESNFFKVNAEQSKYGFYFLNFLKIILGRETEQEEAYPKHTDLDRLQSA